MANMTIAKTHRASRKFVGFITAAGTVIAYFLSFFTIIAGVIVYSWQVFNYTEWYMWIVSAVIGALLSILVERLTLTQAAKVRHIKEAQIAIEDRYNLVEDRTEQVEANKARELEAATRGRAAAILLMLLGIVVSTSAGTLFWHFVLQHLPPFQAWLFSTLFSGIVSFTLVSSELHKRLDAKVIGESIVADNFVPLATSEDARDNVMQQFAAQHKAALEDALDNETMRQIANATSLQTIDSIFKGQGAIPIQISRERQLMLAQQEAERARTASQMKQINAAKDGNVTPLEKGRIKVTQRLDGGDTDELSVTHPF